MSREATPYRHARWPRIRKAVLDRDGWLCQIKGPKCKTQATDADHVIPWRDCTNQRDWYALDNLRASCSPCNISRASNQKHQQGWKRAATDIVLVERRATEPVEIRPEPADVVLDLDRLAAVFAPGDTIHPAHREAADIAWRKVIAELRRGELNQAGRVWIVTTDPTAADQYPYHSRQGPGPAPRGDDDGRQKEARQEGDGAPETSLY